VLERWTGQGLIDLDARDMTLWLMPVSGGLTADGGRVAIGDVVLIEDHALIDVDADSLIYAAYPGPKVKSDLVAERIGTIAQA
jgi:hypothetical protein